MYNPIEITTYNWFFMAITVRIEFTSSIPGSGFDFTPRSLKMCVFRRAAGLGEASSQNA